MKKILVSSLILLGTSLLLFIAAAFLMSGDAFHSLLLKQLLLPLFLLLMSLVAGWFFFDFIVENPQSSWVQTLKTEDPIKYYEKQYRSRIYHNEKEHKQTLRFMLYFILMLVVFAYNTTTVPQSIYYSGQVIFGEVEEKHVYIEKTERPDFPIFEDVNDSPLKKDFFLMTDDKNREYKNFDLHQYRNLTEGDPYLIKYTKDTNIIIEAEFKL